MIALLTAPQVKPNNAYRYMVQLASNELELECEGVPVPANYKMVDVVVSDPNPDAIATLLQAAGLLDGWGIVSHWSPEDCDCF